MSARLLRSINQNERTHVGSIVTITIESLDMLAGMVELVRCDSSIATALTIVVIVVVAVLQMMHVAPLMHVRESLRLYIQFPKSDAAQCIRSSPASEQILASKANKHRTSSKIACLCLDGCVFDT